MNLENRTAVITGSASGAAHRDNPAAPAWPLLTHFERMLDFSLSLGLATSL
jgi:hypothetical protein